MPEHEHIPMGRYDVVRPDGIRDVWWKCLCGLEERRYFDGETCVALRYRYQASPWYDARDLLLLRLPIQLCDACAGDGCERCGELGLREIDGEPVAAPAATESAMRRPT